MARRKLPPEVKAALAELKQELSQLYGERLKGVYLYGSYARGDYHSESDVDILIVLQGPIRPFEEIQRTGQILSDVCLKYDLLISILPVSEEWQKDRVEPLFDNVRREGILL
ncbi:MAG: nucleotidyltransferase domain-containing protein [Chloroflexi bacterium]|nr:nucleotidyltransferase domain-containing protein [Chloroflexota bacterium]